MVKKKWMQDYIDELLDLIEKQHNSQSEEEHALYQKKIDELTEVMEKRYS